MGKCLYSARLYKAGVHNAIFCMCQQHPQYTKVQCIISQTYTTTTTSAHSTVTR